MKRLISFILIIFLKSILFAQAPVITSVTASGATVPRYDKQELTVTFTGPFSNPYDYDEILVRGIFTAPSGKKDTMEGFYMSNYSLNTSTGSLTPTGSNGFRIRYAPVETGTYTYVVTVRNHSGTAASTEMSFNATSSTRKGFVRKNESNYLHFDNGEQYIMIGQNLAWQQNNKYLNFKNWTDKLASNNANFIRLWQCHWGLGIEWTGTPYNGLKSYSQVNSFYTDKLLEECEAKNIYMMLCINHHGMVSTTVNPEWSTSPYNAANGGPCSNTTQYFTNSTARALHKNRLRYIVARWGYSRNIMSWELFNEVDWTDNFSSSATVRSAVRDWHIEMASFLKIIDPFKHLVTTSYAYSDEDPAVWNHSSIDFTQSHFYVGSPNFETVLADGVRKDINRYSKPSYTGEFGVNTSQSSLSSLDPNGIHIHNAVWATLFSGGMGAGSTWWWDTYIEPSNLYYHYKAPAVVAANLELVNHNYKPSTATVSGTSSGELIVSPGVGWGRSPAAAFTIDNSGVMTPSAGSLGEYVYGSQCKSAEKNSPTFTVAFPAASQFRIRVTDVSSFCNAQRLQVRVNGTEVLNVLVSANTTYTVNVPAGAAVIAVDNLGGDWFRVASYTFTNIGSALNTYILKSSDNNRAAGWVHNKKYNWVDAGPSGSTPPVVSGATLTLTGMSNGTYEVQWYECLNGTVVSTATGTASGGTLALPVPNIAWDLAFSAKASSVTSVRELFPARNLKIYPNPVVGDKLVIAYDLPFGMQTDIQLLDISGKKVTTLFNGRQQAGAQLIEWSTNGKNLATGFYFIRFSSRNRQLIEKVLIAGN